jgi:outer membrane protein assembly factor BamD
MTMHLTRSLSGRVCLGGLLIALIALSVLSAGCGSRKKALPPGGTEPDKYLFEQATDALNKKRWLRAREYFRQVVDEYPQSRFRPDSKLGLGDAYLGENSVESLILGSNEFREFLTYYPTHERAHYAQYKLGLSYYDQMLAPQRDQTQTRSAVKEFQAFVERYPNSPLINQGQAKLQECLDRLSDADYDVGYHYYRAKWYPGAISRFRAVLKDNPTYTRRDALYYYLADCYIRMGLAPEAAPLLDRLLKEFEKSEFLVRAKQTLTDIENGTIGSLTTTKKDTKQDPKKGAKQEPKKEEKKEEKK